MQSEIELVRPKSLAEALAALASAAPNGLPLAGGTNVVVELRDGRHAGKTLVDLTCVSELRAIRRENGFMVIGGGATITDLIENPLIAQHAAILKESALIFANPLVRNRATVGGNLVDASPAADTAPPLLALNAEVQLVSQSGSRWVALEDFITGVRKTLRQPEELLLAVRWPVPPAASAGAFYKVGLRKADAISVLSAAVMVELDPAGACAAARVALGAVAPRPFRAHEAEELLVGKPLSQEAIHQAAHLAAEAARPISDIRASAAYRKQVTEVTVRRLLERAAKTLAEVMR